MWKPPGPGMRRMATPPAAADAPTAGTMLRRWGFFRLRWGAFLTPLGLDLKKPGDATEYGPDEGGRWYMPLWHIAGRLLEAGEEPLVLAPGVTASFTTDTGPFLKNFPEPSFQCCLSMTLPWVLEEPED